MTDQNSRKIHDQIPKQDISKNFEKKVFADVFNESKNISTSLKSDNFLSEKLISIQSQTRQQPNQNITINFDQKTASQNSIDDSKTSIIHDEINSYLTSQSFAESVLKLNKNIEDNLTNDIKSAIFQEQQKYVQQLINENLNFKIQKEMTDFKISFSHYFEDVIRAKSITNNNSNNDIISKLEQEVFLLKQSQSKNQQTPQAELQLIHEFRIMKAEMSSLKQTLLEIKNNEERLEQQFQSSQSVLNPNESYIEEIS